MNEDVTAYIEAASGPQREAMLLLRKLIHETVPDVHEDFKWSRPVFRTNQDFAYFKTAKTALTFGFFHSHRLKDPDNRLEGTGKDMRHIKIPHADAIDKELLKAWLQALTG